VDTFKQEISVINISNIVTQHHLHCQRHVTIIIIIIIVVFIIILE